MNFKSEIAKEWRLTEAQKKALAKMGLKTVEDLLYHFPARYGDTKQIRTIDSLNVGDETTIYGRISGLKTSKAYFKKIPMSDGILEDDSGKIKLVWFNQPYIAKMVHNGGLVRVEGKVSERKGELYMSNPKIEVATSVPTAVGNNLFGEDGEEHSMYPVYPESKGITSNWIYHAIQKAFSFGVLEDIQEPIPENILEKYHLPNIRTALIWIHAPKNENDATSARKRFAFEEIFFIQLEKQKEKKLW